MKQSGDERGKSSAPTHKPTTQAALVPSQLDPNTFNDRYNIFSIRTSIPFSILAFRLAWFPSTTHSFFISTPFIQSKRSSFRETLNTLRLRARRVAIHNCSPAVTRPCCESSKCITAVLCATATRLKGLARTREANQVESLVSGKLQVTEQCNIMTCISTHH